MPEPLTIYECVVAGCGGVGRRPGDVPHSHGAHTFAAAGAELREVHVFREEDVRPLREALELIAMRAEMADEYPDAEAAFRRAGGLARLAIALAETHEVPASTAKGENQ